MENNSKYFKTTIFSLTAYKPNHIILVICYNDTYDDLTITFMATQGKEHPYGIPEKRFFDAWMNIIVKINIINY